MSVTSSDMQVKSINQTLGILQDFCNETLLSENINVTILAKLVKVTQHLEKYGSSYRQLLKPIIHCTANMLSTTKNEESVKPHMLKLSYILKECFGKANKNITYNCNSSPAKREYLITSIAVEIEDMIIKKPNLKPYILETLFGPLKDLIISSELNFVGTFEAISLMNLLLNGTNRDIRVAIREANKMAIDSLLTHLTVCGDYEIQQGITEILLRLAPTEQRRVVANTWFSGNSILVTKFSKLGVKDFEAECRDFLGAMNRVVGDCATVYTYTCESIYVGDCQLFKPKNDIYKNLSVDFNMNTASLTFCCCDDFHDAVLVRVKAKDLNNASLVPLNKQLIQITMHLKSPFEEFKETKLKDDTLVRISLRNYSAIMLPNQLKKIFGSKVEIHDDLIRSNSETEGNSHTYTIRREKQRVSEGVKLMQQAIPSAAPVLRTESDSLNNKMTLAPPLLSRDPADIPQSETPSTAELKEYLPPSHPFTPKLINPVFSNNTANLKTMEVETPSTPVKMKPFPVEAAIVTESAGLPGEHCKEVSELTSKDDFMRAKSTIVHQRKNNNEVSKLTLKGSKNKQKPSDDQKSKQTTVPPVESTSIVCNNKNLEVDQSKEYLQVKQDDVGIVKDSEKKLSENKKVSSIKAFCQPNKNSKSESVTSAIPAKASTTSSNTKHQTKTNVSFKALDAETTIIKNVNQSKTENGKKRFSEGDINTDTNCQDVKTTPEKNKEDASLKNDGLNIKKTQRLNTKDNKSVQNKSSTLSKSKVIKPAKIKKTAIPNQIIAKLNRLENLTQESDSLDGVAQLFQSPAPSKFRLASKNYSKKSRLPHLKFLNEQQSSELPPSTVQKRRLFHSDAQNNSYEESHSNNKSSNQGNSCGLKINQTFQLKNSLHIQFNLTPKTTRNANVTTNIQPSVYSDLEELGGSFDKWNKKRVAPCKSYNRSKQDCPKKRGYYLSSVQLQPPPAEDILPPKRPCYLPSKQKEPSLFASYDEQTKSHKIAKTKNSQVNSKKTNNVKEKPKKTQVKEKKKNELMLKELENIWSQEYDNLPDLMIEKQSKIVPIKKPPTPIFLKYKSTIPNILSKPLVTSYPCTNIITSDGQFATAPQESYDMLRSVSSPRITMPGLSFDIDQPQEPSLPPDFEPVIKSPENISNTQRRINVPASSQQDICKEATSLAQTINSQLNSCSVKKTKPKYNQNSIKNSDNKICHEKQTKTTGPDKQGKAKAVPNTIITSGEPVRENLSTLLISNEKETREKEMKSFKNENRKHDIGNSLENQKSSADKIDEASEIKVSSKSKVNSQANDNSKLSLKKYTKYNENIENKRQNSSLKTNSVVNVKNSNEMTRSETKNIIKKDEKPLNEAKTAKEKSNNKDQVEHNQKAPTTLESCTSKHASDTQTEGRTTNNKVSKNEKLPMQNNNLIDFKSSQKKKSETTIRNEPLRYLPRKKQELTISSDQINMTKNQSEVEPSKLPNCTEQIPQYKDQEISSDTEFVADSQPVFTKPKVDNFPAAKSTKKNILPSIVPESSSISPSDEDNSVLSVQDLVIKSKEKEKINDRIASKRPQSQQKQQKLSAEYVNHHNTKPTAEKRRAVKHKQREISSESSAVPSTDSEREHEVDLKKKKFSHPILAPKPKHPCMFKSKRRNFNPRYSSTLLAGQEISYESQKSYKSTVFTGVSLSTIAEKVTEMVSSSENESGASGNERKDEELLSLSTLSQRGAQKSYMDELLRIAVNWTRKTVHEVTSRRCEVVRRFLSVLDLEAEQAEDRLNQMTDLQVRVYKSRNLAVSNFARLNDVLENQSTRDEVIIQQCSRVKRRLQKQLSELLQSHCKELLGLTTSFKAECCDKEMQNLVSSMRAKLALML